MHRLIAEKLAPLRRVLFHSCVVEYEGRAFAFTARSGTGKSTHARLWMRYLGDRGVKILWRGQAVPIRPRAWRTHGLRMPVDGQGRLGL